MMRADPRVRLQVVEATLVTDTLDFAELTSPGGGLDILEVHLRILTKVDH